MIDENEAIDALVSIQKSFDIMQSFGSHSMQKMMYENAITSIVTLSLAMTHKSVDEIAVFLDVNHMSFLDDNHFVLDAIDYAMSYIARKSNYSSKSALYIDYILPLNKLKDAVKQIST